MSQRHSSSMMSENDHDNNDNGNGKNPFVTRAAAAETEAAEMDTSNVGAKHTQTPQELLLLQTIMSNQEKYVSKLSNQANDQAYYQHQRSSYQNQENSEFSPQATMTATTTTNRGDINNNNVYDYCDDDDVDVDDDDDDSVYGGHTLDHHHHHHRTMHHHQHRVLPGNLLEARAEVPPSQQYQSVLQRFVGAAKQLLASATQSVYSIPNQSGQQHHQRQQQQTVVDLSPCQSPTSKQEKFTVDMLNEMRSDSHEKFDWNRAENGRPVWNSKTQYLLAVTSYSIGLGNVWRFPMLVQKNGGAAFIIPFVIMLIIEGIPLFYLELAIGQRMRKAAVSSWNMISPFAAGIGIASAVVSFNVGLYYNTIVAWCLYYFWSSFRTPLPFSQCPTWSNSTYDNANNVVDKVVPECQASSPTQYYWYRETLDVANDINEWNGFNYPIIVCLALAWAISYICLVKGLSSAKYVVYVTATFPYVILTIFLFKALTLEGMSDGIYHLFAPKWHKLADAHVWMESASQVFYSLGLGFGGLIALSSYNPVNNNCYRDAIIVSVLNVLASLYAGLVIFAVLGFKAHNQFDKCVANRELMIDWYLGDHNLRITDFTSAQQNNAYAATELVPLVASVSERGALEAGALFTQRSVQQSASESVTAPTSDYYDVNDALNSIQSLDRQLDQQQGSGQTLDYGDTDTEFIIDASNMISSDYLKSVIDSIPNLPQCDLSAELDKSASGTGLAFIVFTEAVNQFPNASLWAIIFFLMLLTLGLDSQFGNLEGLLASLNDFKNYPRLNRQNVTGVICGISFLLSLQFAHGGGSYFLAIFDQFAGNFPLVIIALFEILAVSHIYGLKRFSDDLELMNGSRPSIFMLACWRYLAPITLVVVMLASAYDLSSSLEYQTWSASKATLETRPWPAWCINMGLFLIISSTIWIPLVAIMCVFKIQLLEAENFSVAWFPSEELREFHNVPDHKVTPIERMLFGFTDDD